MRHARLRLVVLVALLAVVSPPHAGLARAQSAATLTAIDRGMEAYRLDAHIPGMVWGVVKDGKLMHVKGAGLREVDAKRPVTADSLFRIASMTKAFTALTILKLRDDGKLALDAPAETYVPELKPLKYPTDDSPKIRVRELLTHTAGFANDDAWGDRQTPLPESEFTAFLAVGGVPFTRPPATAMEYSNLGYALLGRIITNVSGTAYDEMVQRTILRPLGMTSTSHHVTWCRRSVALSAIDGRTTAGRPSRPWRTAPSARWAASRPAPTTTRSGSRSPHCGSLGALLPRSSAPGRPSVKRGQAGRTPTPAAKVFPAFRSRSLGGTDPRVASQCTGRCPRCAAGGAA